MKKKTIKKLKKKKIFKNEKRNKLCEKLKHRCKLPSENDNFTASKLDNNNRKRQQQQFLYPSQPGHSEIRIQECIGKERRRDIRCKKKLCNNNESKNQKKSQQMIR